MKKYLLLIAMIAFTGIFIACNTNKPTKTIENLTSAFNGESTASAKYAAFADRAKAEGFDTVAIMFRATSKAEAIHAENHKKILAKLGVVIDKPTLGKFEVKTTQENLLDAIKGEDYEISTMYPDFIKTAGIEKSPDAIKSFTWAWDTEKKHKDFYQKAFDCISKTSGEKLLPAEWYVCPICGNTYDIGSVKEACDFCMTPKSKFVEFK
ncbi:MAG: ferritin family protein [bacterium]